MPKRTHHFFYTINSNARKYILQFILLLVSKLQLISFVILICIILIQSNCKTQFSEKQEYIVKFLLVKYYFSDLVKANGTFSLSDVYKTSKLSEIVLSKQTKKTWTYYVTTLSQFICTFLDKMLFKDGSRHIYCCMLRYLLS